MNDKYVYYKVTNKTYVIRDGTVIKVYNGYYCEESKKDPGYYKFPTITKECPV